jgi:hypothetical protein
MSVGGASPSRGPDDEDGQALVYAAAIPTGARPPSGEIEAGARFTLDSNSPRMPFWWCELGAVRYRTRAKNAGFWRTKVRRQPLADALDFNGKIVKYQSYRLAVAPMMDDGYGPGISSN